MEEEYINMKQMYDAKFIKWSKELSFLRQNNEFL